MTRPTHRTLLLLLASLAAFLVTRTTYAGSVEEFIPVDTSILMGSPDPLPPFELEVAFSGLTLPFPVALTNASDGSDRVFVIDQDGYIHVFPNRRDVKETKVFLDLSATVARDQFEEGVLGMAFHPRYRENGEFFVYYTVRPLKSVLSRFRVSKDDPNRADRSSEEKLLEIPQPFWNHNGGCIEFGADGHLYVGLGDGGDANDPYGNGQNLETYLGSILRLDVDRRDPGRNYAVPKDNPFAHLGDKARGEIWALGIRNPWKLTFDRLTGDCWVADVGQEQWEEVNVIVRGGNYGWRLREGKHPFEPESKRHPGDLVDPVWEYNHNLGKSITGGYVYRGKRLPELYGWYLCADFVTGNMFALHWDGQKVDRSQKVANSPYPIISFGEDEAGELYFTAVSESPTMNVAATHYGKIYRLRRASRESPHTTAPFPRKLSQTGLFVSVRDHQVAPGLIPYSVNVPLWSDGGAKDRYIALPRQGEVVFDDDGNWDFPVGTVAVKTFSLATAKGVEDGASKSTQRLETRLLVHSPRGWDGYTYLWNDEQTEATLLDSSLTKRYRVHTPTGVIDQEWYFPSRSDCKACHTQIRKVLLGLNTRQLNRINDYGDKRENQIAALDRLGVFTEKLTKKPETMVSFPDWGSPAASTESLARAYLDVNCAICHAPGGTGLSVSDMRFQVPLADTQLIGRKTGRLSIGPPGAEVVDPGSPERSELLLRVRRRGAGQMPTLASNLIDHEAVKILSRWIEDMKEP